MAQRDSVSPTKKPIKKNTMKMQQKIENNTRLRLPSARAVGFGEFFQLSFGRSDGRVQDVSRL